MKDKPALTKGKHYKTSIKRRAWHKNKIRIKGLVLDNSGNLMYTLRAHCHHQNNKACA